MTTFAIREHRGIFTTVEMLQNAAAQFADRVALRMFRNRTYEEFTYREFSEKVDGLAAALMELGVEPGDNVAVLGENRPEWAIAYLAVHRAGATGVPLDSLQNMHTFRHLIRDSDSSVVIASERFVPDLREVADMLPDGLTIISMGDGGGGTLSMEQLIASASLPDTWPKVSLDDLAVIIYTSGTTGRSKGVMLTHGNLASDVAGIYRSLQYDERDNVLSLLPLHHTFEATVGFLSALYAGASITYARSLKSRDLIEDIRETGASIMLGVPLLYEKMMQGIQRKLSQAPAATRVVLRGLFGIERAGKLFGLNLGPKLFAGLRRKAGLASLTTMSCGGAALREDVSRWFTRLGFHILQGYGLTETSPAVSFNRVGFVDHASSGPPIPGAEIRIQDAGADGIGEIFVRGPMVMRGYYKDLEATREVLDEDGWFRTGDLGRFDRQGRLYITGRKKNVIVNPSGKNIYPEEVEDHINRCPHVAESLVIGQPLPGSTSEEVISILVPDWAVFEEEAQCADCDFDPDEVEAVLRAELQEAMADMPDYKRPKSFEVRDEEFEKTSTRKIKRYLYRREPRAA